MASSSWDIPAKTPSRHWSIDAESQGIIVTSGNNPLPNIEAKYQSKGFGYAGADLHAGGFLTGQAMVAAGLKAGDEAVDLRHLAQSKDAASVRRVSTTR